MKGLQDNSIEFDAKLVLQGDYKFSVARSAILEAIGKGLHFTAIFATNDRMALGAMKAIRDSGLRVPEDCSIVGFDNSFESTIADLTSVAIPVDEIGKNGVNLVIDLMNHRIDPPQLLVLRPRIVIRNSCKIVPSR
jgi:LacI family transcriptional regulator